MKKVLLIIILLACVASVSFAETFWCLNATQNVNTTKNPWTGEYTVDAYRFNYSTVFDLSTYYNYSGSTTPKLSDYNQTNGLNEAKAIGTVGVGGCDHAITYTVNTNGGKFVSQSDPSKYRKFYVVNVPDYSTPGSTGRPYYCFNSSGINYDAPSTLGSNTMTFTAPVTNGNTSTYIYNSRGNHVSVKCASVGLDLFLCMENPSSELEHMAHNDDYTATITVSWHCAEGCPEHSGTFDMVVRGYYGDNTGSDRDSFILIVNPSSDSTSLNIRDMIRYDQTKTIATMTIATTTKEGTNHQAYEWRDHIYAFLSSSPNYNVSDPTGFVLTKITNHSITIPYTLTVYNTTAGAPLEGKVFDGTDHFIEHDHSYCLDLKDYSKGESTNYYAMSYDRYGTYYYAINYSARVDINISDFTVPGSANKIRAVMTDPVTYDAEYTRYIGKYDSNIYYHVVYSD